MDGTKSFVHANPREKANIAAILLWTWTLGFFKTGYGKTIEAEDLYDPLGDDRSNVLGDRLEREWNAELERSKRIKKVPSLLKTILRCFRWEYLRLVLLQTFNEVFLKLGIPVLIGELLYHFKDHSPGAFNYALMYAAGICTATVVQTVTVSHAIYGAAHIGGKIRVAVCSLIYRKVLRLRITALAEASPGKIINLIGNDVNQFETVSVIIHFLWSAPLSVLIVGYLLYMKTGYAGLLGIAALFAVAPIQLYAGKLSSKFRLQTAAKTDERIRLMDEIISGVRVIKMYAWERPFCAMVELARRLELKIVRRSSWIRGTYMTLNLFTFRLAVYCTIVGILLSRQPLSAETIFVFSSQFNILAHTTAAMFFRNVADMADCLVAIRRLQQFLMHDECHIENRVDIISEHSKSEENQNDLSLVPITLGDNTEIGDVREMLQQRVKIAVSLKKLTAKWNQDSHDDILKDISVDIERGKLYVAIGAVGAGKSSTISVILGEMWISEGHVEIAGEVSYASQEAWVFGSTVRQNILFGQLYDHHRYQRVIKACALLSDFEQFPQGDQTIVGERGSSLSGGQKARINLARSVYRQADIYILDDPLSGVDGRVSRHLFEECIQDHLMGKTRILVTHQLQYVKQADVILLLERGKLTKFANYLELLDARAEYASLILSEPSSEAADNYADEKLGARRRLSTSSTKSRSEVSEREITEVEDQRRETVNPKSTAKTTRGSIYAEYCRIGGNWFFVLTVIVFFLLTQLLVVLNDLYFPMMVDAEEKRYGQYLIVSGIENATGNSTDHEYPIEPAYGYIYVYTGIVVSILVIGMARSFLFYVLTTNASQRLHDRAFGTLIRTGMRFFDTNPSGRILNRFSKDTGTIDELLPRATLDAVQTVLRVLGSLIVVCTVNSVFVIPLAVIGCVSCWIRKIYLTTSKSVKRAEGALKSPVFTHMNETLNGLSTIRAYCAQKMLRSEFDRLQDAHSSAWYTFIVASATFGFSLDAFCSIFTAVVTFTLLFVRGYSGATVGLGVTTVISISSVLQWGMRQSAEVSNQVVSVERVLEYTLLPQEDHCSTALTRRSRRRSYENGGEGELAELLNSKSNTWPSEGCITFRHVGMRYADDGPRVLKELSLIVKPREKIGIVGRTGAGKTSLIAALFRLAKIDGVIEIDGVDTGSICLGDLRRHISIIPQDPVLFSGTLRRNLDPFGEFNDEDLWAALEEVELKGVIVNDKAGLESKIFDSGANYSVGQKQLVCLARAILRNNKVLVLDEATANVDPHTDELIQKTIKTKFANATVLTVAHRLNTIMDSDKVLVMDGGRPAEFDHPHILLQDESGLFTLLVKQAGPTVYNQLSKIAKRSYLQYCQDVHAIE